VHDEHIIVDDKTNHPHCVTATLGGGHVDTSDQSTLSQPCESRENVHGASVSLGESGTIANNAHDGALTSVSPVATPMQLNRDTSKPLNERTPLLVECV